MRKIYLILRVVPFAQPFEIMGAYSFRPTAEAEAKNLSDKELNKPSYDDWGLCEGVGYIVLDLALNEERT